MIAGHFQGKPFNITVIQVYAPTTMSEETEVEHVYEELKDLLELTPQKMSSSSEGIKMKTRKSRDTWSNSQVWPWSTK